MSSDDPLEAYRKDWERRKAIANRYGRPCFAAAAISLLLYVLIEASLPESPRPDIGHVYRIFWIGRTYGHGPLFVYGTRWEQWLSIGVAVLGIALFVASGLIYYKYNPGALYRDTKQQLRE